VPRVARAVSKAMPSSPQTHTGSSRHSLAHKSDLAVYRSTYGLPPCTIASGCLTIVNDNGETSPLPAEGSDSDAQGWIGESAFDVDVVSAGCPMCKIVVVEAGAPGNAGLDIGQVAAVKLKVGTISDSWGGAEDTTSPGEEGSLTRQLLMFSRQELAESVIVDLNDDGGENTAQHASCQLAF
jgi:hypothetical protein